MKPRSDRYILSIAQYQDTIVLKQSISAIGQPTTLGAEFEDDCASAMNTRPSALEINIGIYQGLL
jgi:hypothetical protein